VCVFECVCLCVCVCLRKRDSGCMYAWKLLLVETHWCQNRCVCVCVCLRKRYVCTEIVVSRNTLMSEQVCVREREREREIVGVCMHAYMCVWGRGCTCVCIYLIHTCIHT
jgi:hypothetical protein